MFNYIHNVYPDYREIEITIKLNLQGHTGIFQPHLPPYISLSLTIYHPFVTHFRGTFALLIQNVMQWQL